MARLNRIVSKCYEQGYETLIFDILSFEISLWIMAHRFREMVHKAEVISHRATFHVILAPNRGGNSCLILLTYPYWHEPRILNPCHHRVNVRGYPRVM